MEPYDFDTMVIGGGPAGMSAAIRARWLRTYYCLPSDIAIVDKNGLGGISNWKAVIVGTPSWQYVGSQLEDLFRQDFNTFPVEIIHSNARRKRSSN